MAVYLSAAACRAARSSAPLRATKFMMFSTVSNSVAARLNPNRQAYYNKSTFAIFQIDLKAIKKPARHRRWVFVSANLDTMKRRYLSTSKQTSSQEVRPVVV
jgi:hypothetical protein